MIWLHFFKYDWVGTIINKYELISYNFLIKTLCIKKIIYSSYTYIYILLDYDMDQTDDTKITHRYILSYDFYFILKKDFTNNLILILQNIKYEFTIIPTGRN